MRRPRADPWQVIVLVLVLVVIPMLVGLQVIDSNRREDLLRAQNVNAWARYDDQIASCERGNVVRRSFEEQSKAIGRIYEVLGVTFAAPVAPPQVDCHAAISVPFDPRPEGVSPPPKEFSS